MSALFFALVGLVLWIGRRELAEVLAGLMARFVGGAR